MLKLSLSLGHCRCFHRTVRGGDILGVNAVANADPTSPNSKPANALPSRQPSEVRPLATVFEPSLWSIPR
ncbi:hypothetical protein LX32DRAFT_81927 [Colletotrichum zoysiae]|uniref:Uncharacterized protein n=1 Tax=Colletotrichum zoysiae TaxID=1216348 RepID=A0AAD9HBD9_9PEZI|nr:hypothetical protein LX32DRAFT_81927 [Colletotrichum zoysiae]